MEMMVSRTNNTRRSQTAVTGVFLWLVCVKYVKYDDGRRVELWSILVTG